jgi:hypothetical protein
MIVKEYINFERGLNPKKAMGIGRNRFFATLESMSFIEAMKKFPELGHIQINKDILKAAARLLQVPEESVKIAVNKTGPLESGEIDKIIDNHDWQYGSESSVSNFDLIGASTGEIYVKDKNTEDIWYILGTIY